MITLGEGAQDKGIWTDCLSDRLVVESVSGVARSGAPVYAILAMVGEGMDAAEADAAWDNAGQPRRMH